jgi:hypothetical protein
MKEKSNFVGICFKMEGLYQLRAKRVNWSRSCSLLIPRQGQTSTLKSDWPTEGFSWLDVKATRVTYTDKLLIKA